MSENLKSNAETNNEAIHTESKKLDSKRESTNTDYPQSPIYCEILSYPFVVDWSGISYFGYLEQYFYPTICKDKKA